MFSSNRVNIGIVIALLVLIVLSEMMRPQPISWESDYTQYSKKPHATYILRRQLKDLFPNQIITDVKTPIYAQLDDVLDQQQWGGDTTVLANFIYINQQLKIDSLDENRLLGIVKQGADVMIAAENLGALGDTLHIVSDYTNNFPFSYGDVTGEKQDTMYFKWKEKSYQYRADMTGCHWNLDSVSLPYRIISTNHFKEAVFVQIPYGKGSFWLHSAPSAFDNYNLLLRNNNEYAAAMLSHLPAKQAVYWDEYYKDGRVANKSYFRFVLSDTALKWALYVFLATAVLFMLFEAKRQQRIIPIVRPLTNTTLEFTQTVGMLYYQTGDHRDLATKKVTYLLDYIRTQLHISQISYTLAFYEKLAQKTGISLDQIQQLFQTMVEVRTKVDFGQADLLKLNSQMNRFYTQVRS